MCSDMRSASLAPSKAKRTLDFSGSTSVLTNAPSKKEVSVAPLPSRVPPHPTSVKVRETSKLPVSAPSSESTPAKAPVRSAAAPLPTRCKVADVRRGRPLAR